MDIEIYKSDRDFVLFDFSIGLGRLLLRSSKRKNYNKNIDIIFFDTYYIHLFTALNGVSIIFDDVKKQNNDTNLTRLLTYKGKKLFKILSGKDEYFIAASYVKVYENDLNYDESSLIVNNEIGLEIANTNGLDYIL